MQCKERCYASMRNTTVHVCAVAQDQGSLTCHMCTKHTVNACCCLHNCHPLAVPCTNTSYHTPWTLNWMQTLYKPHSELCLPHTAHWTHVWLFWKLNAYCEYVESPVARGKDSVGSITLFSMVHNVVFASLCVNWNTARSWIRLSDFHYLSPSLS